MLWFGLVHKSRCIRGALRLSILTEFFALPTLSTQIRDILLRAVDMTVFDCKNKTYLKVVKRSASFRYVSSYK